MVANPTKQAQIRSRSKSVGALFTEEEEDKEFGQEDRKEGDSPPSRPFLKRKSH